MPAGDEHGDALDPGAECRHPTPVPMTVHAPEREAAERRAAEDAARAAHNVAIAAAVGDGGGGACFEIDQAASPMSRVRQNSVQSTCQGMLSAVSVRVPFHRT